MKLLVIADLHFKESNDWILIDRITNNVIKKVKNLIDEHEEVLVIVLGDIIDRGRNGKLDEKYLEADRFFEKYKEAFENISFLFIPGNHELSSEPDKLLEFNKFTQKYSLESDLQFTADNSVYSLNKEGVNLILVDSTLSRDDQANGNINIDEIKKKFNKTNNLIFLHHPPCAIEGADRSVDQSQELIETRSNFIFYGHQHGGVRKSDFLESDTDIHSVGALLLSDSWCKNEFLLLDISEGKLHYAIRNTLIGEYFRMKILFPQKKEIKSHKERLEPLPKINSEIIRKLKSVSCENVGFKIQNEINTLVRKYNNLLITGEAGVGKSFELARICDVFENDEDYFPIWVEARNTNYENLKRYISYIENNTIDCKIPVLILDGLDEYSNYNTNVVNDLRAAISGNKIVKVIVSVRKSSKIRIDGFEEYEIVPLDIEDLKAIAKNHNIDNVEIFVENLKNADCLDLAKIPFYLLDIIQIYCKDGQVPKREKLLDAIINSRFKSEDEKFSGSTRKSLLEYEFEIKEWLKELSFMMQSCQLTQMDNILYTQNFNEDQREIFIRTGLLKRRNRDGESKWEFVHNIFREYFAAKYICEIKFDELLKIITYDCKKEKLRPSWINTVSFVLSIRTEDDLKTWLIENAKDTIAEFESDKLNEDNRNEVFLSIMEDVRKTDIPIYASVHDLGKLSRYFQSRKTIDFLINILKNKSSSDISIWSSLKILSYCTNFYGKKTVLTNILLEYINKENSENSVRFAIETLINVFYDDPSEVLKIIFSKIEIDERASVISIICELIFIANAADQYTNYISGILKNIAKYRDSLDVMYRVEQCVKIINESQNIIGVLKTLLIKQNPRDYYNSDKLFEKLIDNLGTQVLEKRIFDEIVQIYFIASEIFETRKIGILNNYFKNTKTEDKAFDLLLRLEVEDEKKLFLIENIMNERTTDILIENFKNEVINSSVYSWYAQRLQENSSLFKQLNQVYMQKNGNEIPRRKSIDWETVNKIGLERYFNSLFNKSDFELLLDEILGLLPKDTKCKDNIFKKIPDDRFDLKLILGTIKRWGAVEYSISDFWKNINWDFFSLYEIYNLIRNNEEVKISDVQKEFIKEFCDNKIKKIEFEKLDKKNPKDKEDLFYTKIVIFFIQKFEFSYEDENLLEMLMLPWYYFASSSVNSESEVLKFISSRISDESKLHNKIIGNLESNKLSNSAIPTHLIYCLENKLNNINAVRIAKIILISNDNELENYRISAINYLLVIRGESYVDQIVGELDQVDFNLLTYLSSKLLTDNKCLVKKLIQENKNSKENPLKYLSNLIRLNQKYGIEKYLELAKKEDRIPDFHEDENIIPEVTKSISEINNICLIKTISDLLVLCKSDTFDDMEFWGLNRSVQIAFSNLIQVDAKKVRDELLKLRSNYSDNKKLIQTANWLIKEAESIINISCDIPWEIDDAVDFINQHKPKRLYS